MKNGIANYSNLKLCETWMLVPQHSENIKVEQVARIRKTFEENFQITFKKFWIWQQYMYVIFLLIIISSLLLPLIDCWQA